MLYCLEKIETSVMPNDIVRLYLDIYPFIGRNADMLSTVERDLDVLIATTIQRDAGALKTLFDLNVSESRMRAMLIKDVRPKTKDERLLKNIRRAFEKVHQETDTFALYVAEVHDLLKFLYADVEAPSKLQFAKAEKQKRKRTDLLASAHTTKREALEALIHQYKRIQNKALFEPSYVIVNFYIDFINMKPFTAHNDMIGLFLLYILLLTNGYQSLHLSSFFELIEKQAATFEKHTKDASYNWSEGLADVMPMHRFLSKLLLESYRNLHELLRNYTYDKQTNKSDYIENTINKLDEVFTKEDIRRRHPTISESTINRTLKRLRDEKKIRPLGKGRSASWMKLFKSTKTPSIAEQIKLKV